MSDVDYSLETVLGALAEAQEALRKANRWMGAHTSSKCLPGRCVCGLADWLALPAVKAALAVN
jgi:hypothetical protein